jgi:hypothetical protein
MRAVGRGSLPPAEAAGVVEVVIARAVVREIEIRVGVGAARALGKERTSGETRGEIRGRIRRAGLAMRPSMSLGKLSKATSAPRAGIMINLHLHLHLLNPRAHPRSLSGGPAMTGKRQAIYFPGCAFVSASVVVWHFDKSGGFIQSHPSISVFIYGDSLCGNLGRMVLERRCGYEAVLIVSILLLLVFVLALVCLNCAVGCSQKRHTIKMKKSQSHDALTMFIFHPMLSLLLALRHRPSSDSHSNRHEVDEHEGQSQTQKVEKKQR